MEEIKNPPAFPMCDTEFKTVQEGMTLRDYFAAKVIEGTRARRDGNSEEDAKIAYRTADAMLRERLTPIENKTINN